MTAQETSVVNGVATTLSTSMGAGATSFVVASASGFPAVPFYVVIDPEDVAKREVILVDTSVVTTTCVLSGIAKRFLAGSAATSGLSHDPGAAVWISPVIAQLIQDLNDRIDAAYKPGGTDVAIADGGTGASTVPAAQAALQLTPGTYTASKAALDAEIARATAAEAALPTSSAITTEQTARIAGDATEASTRSSAVAAVQALIDTLNAASVAWVPAITGWGLGNGTLDCWQHTSGKWCDFDFKLTVGSTTTFGSKLLVAPPAAAKRTDRSNVTQGAAIRNSDGFNEPLAVDLVSGNFEPNTMISAVQIQAAVGLTGASPWTWHTGDVVAFSGRIELA